MPQDNISELYNTYGKEVFTNENEFRSYVTTPQGAKDFYSNFAKEAFSSDKEFNNFIGLGKTQPPSSPAVGGGSKLVGGAGVKSTTSPSLGGGTDFGFGGVVEKIGKPQPAMEEVALQEQPQAQPIDGRINVQLNADEILGGGDKNALAKGLEFNEKAMEFNPQTNGFDYNPIKDVPRRKEEIAKFPDEKVRKFETGKLYEDIATYTQDKNKQIGAELQQVQPILEQQQSELEQMQAQLEDPNIQPQIKQEIANEYQSKADQYNQMLGDFQQKQSQFTNNANTSALMLRASNQMGGSILTGVESFGMGAYSIVPSMIRTVGAVSKLVGQGMRPLVGGAVSEGVDTFGDAVMQIADQTEIDASKYSKDIQKNPFEDLNKDNGLQFAGQIVGSIASTILGGGVGGVAGGQMVAASQVYGDTYKSGVDAGLTEQQSMLFALPASVAAAYFSDKGVEAMSGIFRAGGKEALKKAVQQLGTKPTAKAILDAGQKFTLNTVKGGVKEGLQEVVDFTADFATKKGVEEAGLANFEDDLTVKGFLKGAKENFIGGGLGGVAFGGLFGESPLNKISALANEAAKNEQSAAKFADNIFAFRDAGQITSQQADEAMQVFEKAITANRTIPPNVVNASQRTRATELILEQEEVAAQVENTNPAMQAPLIERQKAIDAELAEIAANPAPESPMFEIGSEGKTEVVSSPSVTFTEAMSIPENDFVYNGEKGKLVQEGQTVSFETDNRIYELGNVDELSSKGIDELGIEQLSAIDVVLNDDNSLVIEGEKFVNNFSNPDAAINYDSDGNVQSVNLETEGGQKRTFRGQRAEEIAYQYKLKSLEQNGTDEQIDTAIEQAEQAVETERVADETAPKRKGKSARQRRKEKRLTKPKQDEKAEERPMLEVAQTVGDETKGGQASPELRTEIEAKGEEVNPALKDVESTAKALEGVEAKLFNEAAKSAKKTLKWSAKDLVGNRSEMNTEQEYVDRALSDGRFSNLFPTKQGQTAYAKSMWKAELQNRTFESKQLATAYHTAKADGSNPELVKAVESLLSKEQPTKTKQDESTKQGGTTTPPTSERVTGDQGKTESATQGDAQNATQGDAQNAEAANRQAGVPSQENELAPTAPTSQSVSIFQELDKVPSQSKGKRAKAERAKFDKKHGEKAKQAKDINANFEAYEKKLMDEGVILKKKC